MEVSELRQFTLEELKGRIRQWQDDVFRNRFKTETSEAKDTSVIRKLRKDIARAFTVLNEKSRGVEFPTKAPKQLRKKVAAKETKTLKEDSAEAAPKKMASKKKAVKES